MKTIAYDETLWQLVPKEPTGDMLREFAHKEVTPTFADKELIKQIYGWEAVEAIYKAALAAAPQPPKEIGE